MEKGGPVRVAGITIGFRIGNDPPGFAVDPEPLEGIGELDGPRPHVLRSLFGILGQCLSEQLIELLWCLREDRRNLRWLLVDHFNKDLCEILCPHQ